MSNAGKHWKIADTSNMKGHSPWNKGLTKETDGRVKKSSETSKLTNKNPETIQRHRDAGTNFSWNRGLTKETNLSLKIMADNKIGQHLNETHKNKISNGVKRNFKETGRKIDVNGIKNPFYGKHHLEETRQILSEKSTANLLAGKTTIYQGRSFIREDLKEYGNIMSSFEANYIRYLKHINEPFEYQIPILLSNNRWYICDFYLPNSKQFIELKGYLREKEKLKYELLKSSYLSMKWRMIMQASDEWKEITKKYCNQITRWEK